MSAKPKKYKPEDNQVKQISEDEIKNIEGIDLNKIQGSGRVKLETVLEIYELSNVSRDAFEIYLRDKDQTHLDRMFDVFLLLPG